MRDFLPKAEAISSTEEAKAFLEDVSRNLPGDPDLFQYDFSTDMILAMAAVIEEVPTLSEQATVENLRFLCKAIVIAQGYE